MPTQKCPIITLCKIANAIVRSPTKYPYAQSQRLYFSGIGSRIFSFQRLAHAFFHAPHHPFQRSRDKKGISSSLPMCLRQVQTALFHCITLRLICTRLSTAQQAYCVPHTLAFSLRFLFWYAFLSLRNVAPTFTNTNKNNKKSVSNCLPRCLSSKTNFRFPLNYSDLAFY